jgi:hypothetical protein
METAEVRRRIRGAIERARRDAQERRTRSDAAAKAYETFLSERAVPAFHTFASALVGEGHRFKVFTPAGSVRLSAEGAADDFIELALDTETDPPVVLGRTSRGRGRRNITTERPLKPATPIDDISDDDLLEFILEEITPLLG